MYQLDSEGPEKKFQECVVFFHLPPLDTPRVMDTPCNLSLTTGKLGTLLCNLQRKKAALSVTCIFHAMQQFGVQSQLHTKLLSPQLASGRVPVLITDAGHLM